MLRRTRVIGAASLSLALVSTLVGAGASQAAPGGQSVRFAVVSVTNISNDWTDRTQPIGSCKVITASVGCSVSASESIDQTVGVSLGVTKSFVSGQLSFSTSTSRTISVTCSTTDGARAGQTLVAYPRGKYRTYKVQKTTYTATRPTVVQTSVLLKAFDPKLNAYSCELR
ncbi:hypothetical protein EYE40_03285 [Glaciihabitans arcticus]|uniref:Ig-like domain-containing protein n=1 Tax=Glaciihabitans arcticus TaxID=2668039 RepID=A0A4Q9GWA7_9MICO|nr:hypothetical protein [Glaciihabitans arcticus]TBN56500.1 hypothetical protein EYE40_03285 [Glaciihabitans arcticus]